MRIAEITERYRNDFKYIADCRHCGKQSRHGDGYADHFYCTRVVPDRCCEHCGLNEYGETEDAKQARYSEAAELRASHTAGERAP